MVKIAKTVRTILDTKGPSVWSVSPDISIYEALQVMAEKNIGAVVVMDGSELVGIMSERDYARKVALKGKSAAATPVSDIMTKNVICVEPAQPIEECMALMVGKAIRHLPVLENDHLVGIISIGDVVKAMISEQQTLIEQLESYIRGY
ncbi:MAG: CBS domain-containing protein [Anaerolineales bacterium]|jgi:CBS domain-containing protein